LKGNHNLVGINFLSHLGVHLKTHAKLGWLGSGAMNGGGGPPEIARIAKIAANQNQGPTNWTGALKRTLMRNLNSQGLLFPRTPMAADQKGEFLLLYPQSGNSP